MNTQNAVFSCRLKSYIQPFERELALRELGALSGRIPIPGNALGVGQDDSFILETHTSPETMENRLAYWEEIQPGSNGKMHNYTRQLRFEATGYIAKSKLDTGIFKEALPFNGKLPKPNRRSLRYGSHGIHEYRGKFFPQLVRSLLNIAQTPANGIVLDPMCGSGTTVVESIMMGCSAYGLDMNPLSTLISSVKSNVFKIAPEQLEELWRTFKERLSDSRPSAEQYFDSIRHENLDYLNQWFHPEVLEELGSIMVLISQVESPEFADFLKVALSNTLRRVSWQKESDLRVRLEKNKQLAESPTEIFLRETEASFKSILALAYELPPGLIGSASLRQGDARDILTYPQEIMGKADCIITSPPYATALPYLDTDRLSLYFFDLISRKEHRGLDYRMIGNREITQALFKSYWDDYIEHKSLLSSDTAELIERISDLNQTTDVGFRRKNLPSLLAKYFLDMRKVLDACLLALKPGGWAFFVVGNNHTIAGGQKVVIPTDQLLGQLSVQSGFVWKESLSMELLTSRDIFRKNAGSAETILFLQKP